jgi:uncharacterized protein (TIGR00725 family)
MTRRPTLAVIGDGTAEADSEVYAAAREVGRRAVDAGFRVVTGGLNGVMEAACRGAHESPSYREGDTLGLLPGSNAGNANAWVDVVVATGLGHARNAIVARADVVVAVGGGAGTLSELAFAWIHGRPIVALELPGWSRELGGRRLDDRPRPGTPDDDCVFAAASAAEALRVVVERWQQYRPA